MLQTQTLRIYQKIELVAKIGIVMDYSPLLEKYLITFLRSIFNLPENEIDMDVERMYYQDIFEIKKTFQYIFIPESDLDFAKKVKNKYKKRHVLTMGKIFFKKDLYGSEEYCEIKEL
jgi:hypothetical protein